MVMKIKKEKKREEKSLGDGSACGTDVLKIGKRDSLKGGQDQPWGFRWRGG